HRKTGRRTRAGVSRQIRRLLDIAPIIRSSLSSAIDFVYAPRRPGIVELSLDNSSIFSVL
ncbi:hypothetical protein, partial [Phocaeicola vulgatus]|uniref:hypothetical protein n=1 Tax=Phocaeicola vulgatus TaxID=821 RepID=UPI00321BFB3C